MMSNSFFDNSFGGGFDFGFTVIPILVTIMFIVILTVFVVIFVKGITGFIRPNT